MTDKLDNDIMLLMYLLYRDRLVYEWQNGMILDFPEEDIGNEHSAPLTPADESATMEK